MTNLEIIRYLALNNPERLGELLEDIYCLAWNDGANAYSENYPQTIDLGEMHEWLYDDASKLGLYFEDELKEWSEPIKQHTVEVSYPGGLTVAFPYKDPTYAWNTNNNYEVINQAIDEIHLLEDIIESEKYTDDDYNDFRKGVCTYCSYQDCLQSQMDIVQCPKFQIDTSKNTKEND